MTATMTSTSQAVSEWVKIFPKQAIETYTSSVTFMKQLTVVAISTITYLKNAFPEYNYMMESFGGLKLRILKKKCQDELAQFLSTSLSQAFEAFEKRYLHRLALCFYEDKCKIDNLIEYHIFDYSYYDDGVTMKVHSKNRDNNIHSAKFTFENVKERTIHMIRSCVVLMQSCQNELPSNYEVSLRLYYNEEAPSDYQAPGFLSTNETEDHLDASLAESIRLGWVETPFHKLVARSYIKDTAKASHEAIASQNAPEITQGDVDRSDASPMGRGEMLLSPARDTQLRCPCNLQEDSEPGRAALLTCQYCRTHQHAACFGVWGTHVALVSRHCCADCHDAERSRRPTDDKLVSLSARKRECLCIFRRTLEWCTQRSTINATALIDSFRISEPNTVKLMKLLKSHKIIDTDTEKDLNTPQKIQADQLKYVISRFFQSTGEENIVDRLLAETFASQESHSDPISEVLSPLEKVNLQNASNVCHVVDPVVVSNEDAIMEDSTLKQYREAILSNDKTEELDDITGGLGKGVQRKSVKRKVDEDRNVNRLGLRSGVRAKRARTLTK